MPALLKLRDLCCHGYKMGELKETPVDWVGNGKETVLKSFVVPSVHHDLLSVGTSSVALYKT